MPENPAVPAASLLGEWARQWKVCEAEILDLVICHNTHDEAVRLQQLRTERGWQRLTIVTSALHMKRAQATVQKLNGAIAIVACDFRVYGLKSEPWKTFPFPQTDRIRLLQDYLHELVGGWVYGWRGWI